MAVKEEALNQDLVIAPGEVMTDDELALVQSLSLAFPGAALRGCHFHFTQCLWRKVQKLGLAEDYREKDETVCELFQKQTITICAWRTLRVIIGICGKSSLVLLSDCITNRMW